jgi:hypothetical protein
MTSSCMVAEETEKKSPSPPVTAPSSPPCNHCGSPIVEHTSKLELQSQKLLTGGTVLSNLDTKTISLWLLPPHISSHQIHCQNANSASMK